MSRDRVAAALTTFGLALIAIVVAGALAAVVLALTGADAFEVGRRTLEYGTTTRSAAAVIDRAVPYYLAGIAAAIAFRAGLFNIGIDGQYRLAVLAAAAVGAAVALPAPLQLALMVGTAMVVGAGWAAIAGLLAAYRGVSVVIGTIMLNAIATGLIAWLLDPSRLGSRVPGSNNLSTATIAESGWLPAVPTPVGEVGSAVLGAIVVGGATWVMLGRTRYGFDLRALGMSMRAARVSGPSSHAVPSWRTRKRPTRSLAVRSSWHEIVTSARPSRQAMCSTKRVLPHPVGPFSITASRRAWQRSNSATSSPDAR